MFAYFVIWFMLPLDNSYSLNNKYLFKMSSVSLAQNKGRKKEGKRKGKLGIAVG